MIVLYTPLDSFKTELSQAQDFQLNAKDNEYTQKSGDIEKKMTELAAFSQFTPAQKEEWDSLQSQMAEVLAKWKDVTREKSKRNMSRQYVYEDAK